MVSWRNVESLAESWYRCLPVYIKDVFIETRTYLEIMLIRNHTVLCCM